MGMIPLGLTALNMLRIKSGLIYAGSKFDDQTDPMAAGIGFAMRLKGKTDDFIGRTTLEARKANPQKKLVGLDLAGGFVPTPGDCVHFGKPQIGIVTSAAKSPILGKVITLARDGVTHAEVGSGSILG